MKKVFPFLLVAILVSLIGYQTLAYFTTQDTATNVMTTGDIDIALTNLAVDEDGDLTEFDTTITQVLPGDVYSQMPYVTNTGSVDFYARIHLDTVIEGKDGEDLDEELLSFDIDPTKWVLDEDGWYRYVDIIKVGEQCPDPLFTEIAFDVRMDNSYIGSTTTVSLQAQAVQSDYNEHDDVLDVEGFPATDLTGGN